MENKVIFNKKFWIEFYHNYIDESMTEGRFIEEIEILGLMQKSAVEEAEEMYKKWNYNHNNNIENGWSETVAVIKSIWLGFQELKAENERLKK